MTYEQKRINASFENYLQSSLDKAARERIAARRGETIAARVEAIYKDALNCPVDSRTATMNAELAALHQFLDEKYGWLSEKARTNINYAFIMCWK